MSNAQPLVRCRHNSAITVAAIVTMIAGVSVASWAPILLPLLVIPLLVAVWGWRSGTDATPRGLTIRAALGSRHVNWADISRLTQDGRGRVVAHLTSGATMALPAVTAGDLANLVAAAPNGPATAAQ